MDKILDFLTYIFMLQLIPFSYFFVRLFLGVFFIFSVYFAFSFSGRGLFGNMVAILLLIPILWILEVVGLKYTGHLNIYNDFNFDQKSWIYYWIISGIIFSIVLVFFSRRITDKIQKTMDKLTQRSLPRVQDTELIYKEHDELKTKPYNPEDFWKVGSGKVFLSRTVKGEPIYVDYNSFLRESHANSTGKSRMGKNVAAQSILVQLMQLDELVVMCDAKSGGDDKMAMVLFKYSQKYNKPYNYVELSLQASYQFNILQIKDVDFLKQILMQLAKLGETDDMAVGYHLGKDDATAQKIAFFVANSPEEITINDIITKHYSNFFNPSAKEPSTLQTALTKLAYKNCINARNGFRYSDIIKAGGCCYIQAKTRDDNVILSVIISSLRFVRTQQRITRIVTVFADEFQKYGGSQDFIDIFTEGAGKGFKLITAYQTSALLEAKAIGKTSEQMLSVIMANNNIEFIYGTRDPLVLDVFEEHYTGTRIRNEETKDIETSIALADKGTGNKKIKEVLVARYPKELLTKLRTGEHFLYRAGELLELCYNGYLPLPREGTPEYNELLKQATTLTLVALAAEPEPKQKQENSNTIKNEVNRFL